MIRPSVKYGAVSLIFVLKQSATRLTLKWKKGSQTKKAGKVKKRDSPREPLKGANPLATGLFQPEADFGILSAVRK